MKNKAKITAILLLTTLYTGTKQNEEQMKTRTINPWKWQNERSYAQAVEVTQANGTLYVSGQTAIDANGKSSTADMETQLIEALKNLDKVIEVAGYENKNIVRLNIYTTSTEELFSSFNIFQDWIAKNNIKQTSTVLEVKSLFETLKVELEATVVR